MNMPKVHIIQPYLVGSEKSQSQAVVIPSEIVKKYHINRSTGFILKPDDLGIYLEYISIDKKTLPVDQSLDAKDQQAIVRSEG